MNARRIALGAWVLVAVLYLATLALAFVQPWAEPDAPVWHTVAFVFACLGALISVRRPGNRIGALFLVSGGLLVLSSFMRDFGFVFVPLLTLVSIGSLIVRIRRSTGQERQQLKWFGYPFLLVALYILFVWGLGETALGVTFHPLIQLAGAGMLLVIPGSVTIAVLRYRLYEIDRLISRTVSYAVLTLLLSGIYVAGVLGLGSLVRAVTGGGGGELVVAASTLAVAAAFGPLRRRVRSIVDRRFNRARYDAQRTVESFAQRLRDEVDIGSAREALAATASVVIQPRKVGVWLRTDGEALR